jgi:propionyl-CoA carboxylase alpha chain
VFEKILIANRGEIACRVIKTAKQMGIRTVAVYSDADRGALHVELADEAVHIGPAPSAESYLIADRIIAACQQTGAQAVHPGYGFLSENADFAAALAAVDIVFIGPLPHAITSMGDKITSKKIAEEAGVSVVPGFTGVLKDADHAVKVAKKIGYPVMLKASAGGGGKGMRVAWDDNDCRDGFERATSEAQSSFGDARVFAEKFIEEPRHIEIQVLADSHGSVVYLGERECSIQRRHQKVIEEAPSPFLDEKTRQAMGEQACTLAKTVDYRSAGTVEFIVDQDRNFYFLEMNTRLQVEHPVTELVTGLDLVELMLRIAAGEALPIAQKDVVLKGWALEARVYAEDPFRDFMPSIGRLIRYREPTSLDNVRVDTGIVEGSEVSMYYDPMIAKLCTWGDDRPAAIATMGQALDEYYIRGVSHNISFLNAVIAHPRFAEGRLSTNFIAEEFPDGFQASDVPTEDPLRAVAAATVIHAILTERARLLSGQIIDETGVPNEWVVVVDGEHHPITVTRAASSWEVLTSAVTQRVVTTWIPGNPLFHGEVNGVALTFQVDGSDSGYRLSHRGTENNVLVLRPGAAELLHRMPEKEPPDLSKFLLAPMPGLLVKLAAQVGDEVKAGEELAVVEAMKMENSLRAPQDVQVKSVMAEAGSTLSVDQAIMEFE